MATWFLEVQGFTKCLLRGVDVSLQPPLPLAFGDGLVNGEPKFVGIIFEVLHLPQFLLQMGVPEVLDVIVRPLRKVRSYGCPSAVNSPKNNYSSHKFWQIHID